MVTSSDQGLIDRLVAMLQHDNQSRNDKRTSQKQAKTDGMNQFASCTLMAYASFHKQCKRQTNTQTQKHKKITNTYTEHCHKHTHEHLHRAKTHTNTCTEQNTHKHIHRAWNTYIEHGNTHKHIHRAQTHAQTIMPFECRIPGSHKQQTNQQTLRHTRMLTHTSK